MGFRNPITTVAALDTGPASPAGVRIYQDTGGSYPVGTVEWYSGLAGSAKATSGPVVAPGGASTTGTRTKLTGATGNGAVAPFLELNVEEVPAGGYQGVGRITADLLQMVGPVRATDVRLLDTGDLIGAGPATGWALQGAPYNVCFFQRTVEGWVNVTAVLNYTGGGTTKLVGLSGKFAPSGPNLGNKAQLIRGSVNDTFRDVEVRSDGIYLRGALPAVGQFVAFAGTYCLL